MTQWSINIIIFAINGTKKKSIKASISPSPIPLNMLFTVPEVTIEDAKVPCVVFIAIGMLLFFYSIPKILFATSCSKLAHLFTN